MYSLSLLHLNEQCQLSKTLALTVELIFWIPGLAVNPRNVVMDSNNNSNVLRHLLSNNDDNHLRFQITRKSLITWKNRLLNRNVFWLKLFD
jgi:hypothetical protein